VEPAAEDRAAQAWTFLAGVLLAVLVAILARG
jgi:uncharacterized integral membrane protein